MKQILTNNIQLNVERQPFSSTSIDWINQASQEIHPVIATMFGLDQTALTEIYDEATQTKKYVYVDGIFYRVPAPGDSNQDATIADPVTNGRYVIGEGFAASDPVTMTNGDQENVHSDKYIYIADVAKVGGGDKFDLGNEKYFNKTLRVSSNVYTRDNTRGSIEALSQYYADFKKGVLHIYGELQYSAVSAGSGATLHVIQLTDVNDLFTSEGLSLSSSIPNGLPLGGVTNRGVLSVFNSNIEASYFEHDSGGLSLKITDQSISSNYTIRVAFSLSIPATSTKYY